MSRATVETAHGRIELDDLVRPGGDREWFVQEWIDDHPSGRGFVWLHSYDVALARRVFEELALDVIRDRRATENARAAYTREMAEVEAERQAEAEEAERAARAERGV